MNDTSAIDPAAIVRNFSAQIAFLAVHPPKAGALFYLLPPCLVLIAIDVSTRLAKRPKIAIENAESAAKEQEVEDLVRRVQDALTKFRALEKRLSTEKARSQHLARMLRKQQNFTVHRQRLSLLKSPAEEGDGFSKAISAPSSPEISHVRVPFSAFCERLILQNRIWAQQREVKALQARLATMKKSNRTDAFRAFCERLVLSNRIWKQQEAVDGLHSEAEMLKRSRQHVVTRAAEKMALDVEKERLIEDFVKNLLAEVEDCQRALISLRLDHEQEMHELAQDWREECRRLSREVKRLELSRDAHLVEQDLSNEQERELLERLNFAEEDTTLVLDVINEAAEDQPLDEETQDAETYSESELERMSNMSTSTCVASAGIHTPARKDSFSESHTHSRTRSRTNSLKKQQPVPLPPLKLVSRRPSMSIILSPSASSASASSPVRKLEAGPYAGFSFNPRFFGSTSNPSPAEHSDAGSSARVRTYSLQSPTPHDRMRTYSLQSERGGSTSYGKMVGGAREPPKRAQWRL